MARDAYIRYNNRQIELGIVNSISDSISSPASIPVMPTLKAEEQFGMDTGATNSLTVTSNHINGQSQTNRTWMNAMIGIVNRWQAGTNGNTFRFRPDSDSADLIPEYNENVYVSNLTFKWSAGSPEVIQATTQMKVGSICGAISPDNPEEHLYRMHLRMTDATRDNDFYLATINQGTYQSVISSFDITGGPNQPFESITLSVQRRELLELMGLDESDNEDAIQPGMNLIRVSLYDENLTEYYFIVTSLKATNNVYTITGYSIAELLKGTVLPADIDCNPSDEEGEPLSPLEVIERICEWGVTLYLEGEEHHFAFNPQPYLHNASQWATPTDGKGYPVFKKGMNAWYVLQACGYALSARIHFTSLHCIIDDFDGSLGSFKELYLGYDFDGWDSTGYEHGISRRLVKAPVLGSSENNDVINVLNLFYGLLNSEGVAEYSKIQVTSEDLIGSDNLYGPKSATRYLPGIDSSAHARQIGLGIIRFGCFSFQNIEFTTFAIEDGIWTDNGVISEYQAIYDKLNEFTANGYGLLPECRVKYTLHFPQCTTTFEFGSHSQVNLSNTVSQIEQAISNRRIKRSRFNFHMLIKAILDGLTRIWNLYRLRA